MAFILLPPFASLGVVMQTFQRGGGREALGWEQRPPPGAAAAVVLPFGSLGGSFVEAHEKVKAAPGRLRRLAARELRKQARRLRQLGKLRLSRPRTIPRPRALQKMGDAPRKRAPGPKHPLPSLQCHGALSETLARKPHRDFRFNARRTATQL